LPEKEIEIKLEISKKAALLRKPVKFSDVPGKVKAKYFLYSISLTNN